MLMVAELFDAQAIHKHLNREPGDPLEPNTFLSHLSKITRNGKTRGQSSHFDSW